MFEQTVHTWLYGEMELSKIAKRLCGIGAEGLELGIQKDGLYAPQKLLKRDILTTVSDYGLKIPSTMALFSADGLDLSHSDHATRMNTVEFTKRCIDVTASIGCDRLQIVPSHISNNCSYHTTRCDDWSRAVDSIRMLGEYAAGRAVMLMIEPINRYRVALVRTVNEALHMIRDIDLPNIHIAADVFHMQMEEPFGIAQALRITGVHAKCVHLGDNTRYPPGLGTIDWKPIILALRDIEYDGPLAHEPMFIDIDTYKMANDEAYAASFDRKLQYGIAYIHDIMQACCI